jgi:hypothetical protein
MPGKSKRPRRVGKRRIRIPAELDQEGYGFWGDLWNGAKKAFGWVRDNKVISKAANALGQGTIANVAGQLGFGRRMKIMPHIVDQQGGSFFGSAWDKFKKATGWVKDRKVISKGLDAFGQKKYADIARQLGYGQTGGALIQL